MYGQTMYNAYFQQPARNASNSSTVSFDTANTTSSYGTSITTYQGNTNNHGNSSNQGNTASYVGNNRGRGGYRGRGNHGNRGGSSRGKINYPVSSSGISGIQKVQKIVPYRTSHLYDCPTVGPVHCTTCDVHIPSYSIAVTHFNSPKHHRKRMNELHYPSEKKEDLSEGQTDGYALECVVCRSKPGAIDGFIQHMYSPKHLRKLNNLGPESRAFNITCDPCSVKLVTIEQLSEHCKTPDHIEIITEKIKADYPDHQNSSIYHCEPCGKSCNSMMTFDAHCSSQKHKNKVKELKQPKPSDGVETDGKPPLAIEPEVVMTGIYQCKVCTFGTSDKYLMDKHYETESHKSNKLLKRRHDELFRVADLAKKEYKGQKLGDIVPINGKGKHKCEVCDLSFADVKLLGIHNRGRLHLDMEAKHDNDKKAAAQPKIKGGHHCEPCNIHTTCLTVYIAHISGKAHRQIMAAIERGDYVPASTTSDTATTEDSTTNTTVPQAAAVPDTQPQGRTKKKKNKKGLGSSDADTVVPEDGIPPEIITDDGRFHCKPCNVYVHQKHAYLQHCKGRRHLNKTRIDAGTSTDKGNSADKGNSTDKGKSVVDTRIEQFHCKMCDVSCYSGEEIVSHLSSDEHMRGPRKSSQSDMDTGNETEAKTAYAVTTMYYCATCDVDCRTEGAYKLHLDGYKHMKKVTLLTDEANKVLGTRTSYKKTQMQSYSCMECNMRLKSKAQFEQHMESFKHKKNVSKTHINPHASANNRPYPANKKPRYNDYGLHSNHNKTQTPSRNFTSFAPAYSAQAPNQTTDELSVSSLDITPSGCDMYGTPYNQKNHLGYTAYNSLQS